MCRSRYVIATYIFFLALSVFSKLFHRSGNELYKTGITINTKYFWCYLCIVVQLVFSVKFTTVICQHFTTAIVFFSLFFFTIYVSIIPNYSLITLFVYIFSFNQNIPMLSGSWEIVGRTHKQSVWIHLKLNGCTIILTFSWQAI